MGDIITIMEGAKILIELGLVTVEATKKIKEIFQGCAEDRAIKFLKQLNIDYWKEKKTEDHQHTLDELLSIIKEDNSLSENFYIISQRVIRSSSKNTSPCIIGIILAQVLNEKRDPTFEEELIFQACDILTDLDFKNFISYFDENKARIKEKNGNSFIHLESQTADRDDAKISPQKHVEKMGTWAVKLKKVGFFRDDISQRIENIAQRELSKTLGGSGKITGSKSLLHIYHDLIIEKSTFKLLDLAKRILTPENEGIDKNLF